MANYQETIQEINDTYEDIKKKIQSKYDKVMNTIIELDGKITKVLNSNNTQRWIDDQVSKLQKKIDDKKKALEDWLQKQLEAAQKWVDGILQIIKEKIAELLLSMIKALA
jgi:2-hydroxy-3-keto-5-methylthiopentenyl-1-phosphate phosphatase